MPRGQPATGPEVISHLAANVRRLRLRSGMTQEELAEAVDVPTLRVQRIERGEADVRISLLVALAATLAVPISRLLKPSAALDRPTGRPRQPRKRT